MVVPLIFRQGAAGTAFTVILICWLVFEAVMTVVQRLRASGPASMDRTYLLLLLCLGASIVVGQELGRHGDLPWPGGLVWPVAVGLVLMVAGLALRIWSIVVLGRFFQYQITVQPGHRVVTSGPYRYVRHPSYTGIALILVGFALACDDVWSLVAVAVLGGIGMAVRIRVEEQQLRNALGEEYDHFASQRKRLVPGLL